jgi:hypothetical protein
MKIVLATAVFVLLHAPNNDLVAINPDQIVSMRKAAPDKAEDKKLYHESVKCLLNLADGKFFGAVEQCSTVNDLIKALEEGEKK